MSPSLRQRTKLRQETAEDIILPSLYRTLLKKMQIHRKKLASKKIRFHFYERKNKIVENFFDFLHPGVVADNSLAVAVSLEVPIRSRRRPRSAITRISLRTVKMMVSMTSLMSSSTARFQSGWRLRARSYRKSSWSMLWSGSDESEGDDKKLKEEKNVSAAGNFHARQRAAEASWRW